jgi:hypothetical protein
LTRAPLAAWQATLDDASAGSGRLAAELPPAVEARVRGHVNRQVVVALILLVVGSVVAWQFRRGVTRGLIRMAAVVLAVYLLLITIVVGDSLAYLARNPGLLEDWWQQIEAGAWTSGTEAVPVAGWWSLALASAVLFPQLALGLSGFELTLTAMPLVRGSRSDTPTAPRGRIRNTRLLLASAALAMSLFLLASTLATTVLIPAAALAPGGRAENRALSYLAHGEPLAAGATLGLAGPWLGTTYDLAAIAALTLAGVTVVVGMRHLIPPYLYRLGMDWRWSRRWGVLMYLFVLVKFGVTYVYEADPAAQRGAYLTGVLSVFTYASLAAAIDVWKRRRGWWKPFRVSPYFALCFVAFAGATVAVVRSQPGGLKMAAWFVGLTLAVSVASRFARTTELRFRGFSFADDESRRLWNELVMRDYPLIVPIRPDGTPVAEKEARIRAIHRLPASLPVVFLHAELGDPSDFFHLPEVRVGREDGRVVAHITQCASIPHVIAAAALEVAKCGQVPEVHFGWSVENPLTANLNFVLFGHGNVPWMVHELIRAADFPAERKPRVVVG